MLHFYGILHIKIPWVGIGLMEGNIECKCVYYYGKLMLDLCNVAL
jgi:hypothetical protein